MQNVTRGEKILLVVLMLVAATTTLFSYGRVHDVQLHVIALAVGQGDAIFIGYRGRHILVDTGPDAQVLDRLDEVLPAGNRTIDALILTHTDSDHIGGAADVLAHCQVRTVYVNPSAKDTATWQQLSALLEKYSVHTLYAGARVQIADLSLDILAPNAEQLAPDENNRSIVARLTQGQHTAILTGDMEAPSEQAVLAAHHYVRADVLKVAHHGSKTSTTEAWLAAVAPACGIISVGAKNRYHHPAEGTLARLAVHAVRVFRTDQIGSIDFFQTCHES